MIVIRNTTVVDVIDRVLCPGRDIWIENDSIKEVVPTGRSNFGSHVTVVDGQGQFAIPGLWDMHIHWHERDGMALFPLYGIAGVRVMWGMPDHFEWQGEFGSRNCLGPKMTIASPVVDGPDPLWPESIVVSNKREAVEFARATAKSPAAFLKVYSVLDRSSYLALLQEAHRLDLPVDGHVPITVDVRTASSAGHRCMEHLLEIQVACSRAEQDIRRQRELLRWKGMSWSQIFDDQKLSDWTMRTCLETFDPDKANALFELFQQNETWHCPTLTVLRNLAFLGNNSIVDAEAQAYVPRSFQSFMCPQTDPRSAARRQLEQDSYRQLETILRMMHEQGVPLIAGTDASNPFCYPGASLHTELELFVAAGLDPFDALQAATAHPARFLNAVENQGAIRKGHHADIVLLRNDPTKNIRHTRDIVGVLMRGEWISQDQRREHFDSLRDRD